PADGVCEYLFPFGTTSADEAITHLMGALGTSGRREFDDIVQCKLRAAGRGVIQLGVRPEWGAKLITLLVDEAKGFLDGRANRISVSQALAMHFASAAGLQDYIRELLDR